MDVGDVLTNYLEEEKLLEEKLRECERLHREKRNKLISREHELYIPKTRVNPDDARRRNEQILKDLEVSRARLRTFSSFTPTDQELGELVTTYRTFLHRADAWPSRTRP